MIGVLLCHGVDENLRFVDRGISVVAGDQAMASPPYRRRHSRFQILEVRVPSIRVYFQEKLLDVTGLSLKTSLGGRVTDSLPSAA